MDSPGYDLEAVRRQIPLLRTHIPMNNCSQAPQSRRTRDAAETYLESWARDGMDWDTWIGEVERARGEFAALIGARVEDVAVASSVSQAAASVASGLDFTGRRHRVVVSGAEFPTVSHVWLAQKRFGAEVDRIPVRDDTVPLEAYAEVVDERTLVVSAARGYYQNGWKQEVGEVARIAHERGALVFVDAYQTLGTELFEAPACGADFVASGNLKFLMGIPGIAFLWVRPQVARNLEPAVTGWFGRRNPMAFDAERLDWADGARRLDTGTPPVLQAYVARAGMAWLRELGLDAIQAWTRSLSDRLVEGGRDRGLEVVGPTDSSRKAPTTAFRCEDSHEVEMVLRGRGILASARGSVVRLAPHFYNTPDDVDQALDELASVIRSGGSF